MTISDKEIMDYLTEKFQGVASGDIGIKSRFDNYVQFTFAKNLLEYIQPYLHKKQTLLDIGSGFGSFVYLLRNMGIEAFGIEILDFLVRFSRQRFEKNFNVSSKIASEIYIQDTALNLPFSTCTFDIITIWNVLEHVTDYKTVIQEATRVLKPGGKLFIMNVNYASCFIEPHYRVFWLPYLPKFIGSVYLKLLNRNPTYIKSGIFYVSNYGVIKTLLKQGLSISNSKLMKLSEASPRIASKRKKIFWKFITFFKLKFILKIIFTLEIFNPFCSYINIIATKD